MAAAPVFPIPKFARVLGFFRSELRDRKERWQIYIFGAALNLKFL
jgi:hypothetical protein